MHTLEQRDLTNAPPAALANLNLTTYAITATGLCGLTPPISDIDGTNRGRQQGFVTNPERPQFFCLPPLENRFM